MKRDLSNLVIFTICFAVIGAIVVWVLPRAEEYAIVQKPLEAPSFFNKQYKVGDQVIYYYRTIKIDGCEYLAFPGGITHKGICSNPCHLFQPLPFDVVPDGKAAVAQIKKK